MSEKQILFAHNRVWDIGSCLDCFKWMVAKCFASGIQSCSWTGFGFVFWGKWEPPQKVFWTDLLLFHATKRMNRACHFRIHTKRQWNANNPWNFLRRHTSPFSLCPRPLARQTKCFASKTILAQSVRFVCVLKQVEGALVSPTSSLPWIGWLVWSAVKVFLGIHCRHFSSDWIKINVQKFQWSPPNIVKLLWESHNHCTFFHCKLNFSDIECCSLTFQLWRTPHLSMMISELTLEWNPSRTQCQFQNQQSVHCANNAEKGSNPRQQNQKAIAMICQVDKVIMKNVGHASVLMCPKVPRSASECLQVPPSAPKWQRPMTSASKCPQAPFPFLWIMHIQVNFVLWLKAHLVLASTCRHLQADLTFAPSWCFFMFLETVLGILDKGLVVLSALCEHHPTKLVPQRVILCWSSHSNNFVCNSTLKKKAAPACSVWMDLPNVKFWSIARFAFPGLQFWNCPCCWFVGVHHATIPE